MPFGGPTHERLAPVDDESPQTTSSGDVWAQIQHGTCNSSANATGFDRALTYSPPFFVRAHQTTKEDCTPGTLKASQVALVEPVAYLKDLVMMTGRLVYHKGSLARAALPFVVHLRWGWHRVERAMERGKVVLDVLFDHAYTWCVANLPVEPVRLGSEERELVALDTSTIARLRAGARLALAGKGFCHRAGRAVRANIVAAATSIVM